MKKTLLALIALSALAAACHERRKDPTADEAEAVRARAGESQSELQKQQPPPSDQAQ